MDADSYNSVLFRSDQYPFLHHDVPGCGGSRLHPDYHQVSDTVERSISRNGEDPDARLSAGFDFADSDRVPKMWQGDRATMTIRCAEQARRGDRGADQFRIRSRRALWRGDRISPMGFGSFSARRIPCDGRFAGLCTWSRAASGLPRIAQRAPARQGEGIGKQVTAAGEISPAARRALHDPSRGQSTEGIAADVPERGLRRDRDRAVAGGRSSQTACHFTCMPKAL